jgi:hypothetical protein
MMPVLHSIHLSEYTYHIETPLLAPTSIYNITLFHSLQTLRFASDNPIGLLSADKCALYIRPLSAVSIPQIEILDVRLLQWDKLEKPMVSLVRHLTESLPCLVRITGVRHLTDADWEGIVTQWPLLPERAKNLVRTMTSAEGIWSLGYIVETRGERAVKDLLSIIGADATAFDELENFADDSSLLACHLANTPELHTFVRVNYMVWKVPLFTDMFNKVEVFLKLLDAWVALAPTAENARSIATSQFKLLISQQDEVDPQIIGSLGLLHISSLLLAEPRLLELHSDFCLGSCRGSPEPQSCQHRGHEMCFVYRSEVGTQSRRIQHAA